MLIPEQTESVRRDRRQYPFAGLEPDENGVFPLDVFDDDDDDDDE